MTDKLDAAIKQAKKERDAIKTEHSGYKREIVLLKAKVSSQRAKLSDLNSVSQALELASLDLAAQITTAQARIADLEHTEQTLLQNRTSLETDVAAIADELASRKATLDSDLEQYALVRKQEIKDSILTINSELVAAKKALEECLTEIANRRENLANLNQTAIAEESEARLLHEQHEIDVANFKEEVAALKQRETEAQTALDAVLNTLNQAKSDLRKTQAEHEKFLEYERQACKILDTKDQQLQTKAAELAHEGQFLANRRSYLPEL